MIGLGKHGYAIFVLHVVGEIHHERFQCLAHQNVVDYCGAEEDGHEDDRPRCSVDGEESDQTDFGEVDACH